MVLYDYNWLYIHLVGGFNPSEKNISQNGNLPQLGVQIKHIWNQHLAIYSRGGPSCKKICSPDFCKKKKNTGLSRLCDLPLPWNMQLQPHPWRVRKGSSYLVMLVGILGWCLRQAMLQDEGYNPLAPPSGWIKHISPYFNHPKKKNWKKTGSIAGMIFLLYIYTLHGVTSSVMFSPRSMVSFTLSWIETWQICLPCLSCINLGMLPVPTGRNPTRIITYLEEEHLNINLII